jgi:hypothetical protein
MIVSFDIDHDDLADGLVTLEYEDLVKVLLRVDEIQSDSAFTDAVLTAFENRWYETREDRA